MEAATAGRFAGKVALVIGGGSGIGEAIAGAFARDGARVVVACRSDAGERVAAAIRNSGGEARFVATDATVDDDVAQLVQTTLQLFGRLDIAANVVGDPHPEALGPYIHEQSLESWQWTQRVTLDSMFLSMKHELAHMIGNGGGSIVNVSSVGGMFVVPDSGAAYSAAKAGVIHLTRFTAVAYASHGVRINCVAPGPTNTPAFEKGPPGLIDELAKAQPIQKRIEPIDQAEAAAWLCSDAARMITGHTVPVDGGWAAD